MSLQDNSLGLCPVCRMPFIRNRRDKFQYRTVTLVGESPPDKAFYPEVRFDLVAVWCPACGWVNSVESPDLGLHWVNTEADKHREQAGSRPS